MSGAHGYAPLISKRDAAIATWSQAALAAGMSLVRAFEHHQEVVNGRITSRTDGWCLAMCRVPDQMGCSFELVSHILQALCPCISEHGRYPERFVALVDCLSTPCFAWCGVGIYIKLGSS